MDTQMIRDFFDRLAPEWDAEMIRDDKVTGIDLSPE